MKVLTARIVALILFVVCQTSVTWALDLSDHDVAPTPETLPRAKGLDRAQREALEILIKNLENKQARQQFLNELHTLLKAEERLAHKQSSAGWGLGTISEGLHAITSKIIAFFDELQSASGRLAKYLKEDESRLPILTTAYWILGILAIGLAVDSGLNFCCTPLRRLFVIRARREHLSQRRFLINISIFEALVLMGLFVSMLAALSFFDSASTSSLVLRLLIVTLTFYLMALHIVRFLFPYKRKIDTVFCLHEDTSKLTYRFLRFVAATTALGIGTAESINLIGGSPVFYTAVIKSMLLIQCVFATVFVRRVKDRVKSWLLSEQEEEAEIEAKGLSVNVARTWHIWAITYIFVFGLTIYFQTISDMKEVVVSFGATAFLVSIAYLLVLKMPVISYKMMDKVVESFPHIALRRRLYSIFISLILGIFIIITVLYCAFKIWDIETVDFLFSDGVKPVFTALLNIFFIILIGVLAWEGNEYLIQKIFKNETKPYKSRARRQRLATMMPLVQIVARIFILGIFVIMIFSELKLDVTPLLAGLGVIGIAFSFGSQSLVKDFITGIFILIEDTMNVGDIIQIDTQKGTVETLSLRTVKLRDVAGDLHTIPFSSINRITNMTKNFAYYVIELLLPFKEDAEFAIQTIREVDEQMRADPDFKDYILGPIEVMGIDRFSDYGIVLMARVKTVPDKNRWVVGREFNLRIQKLFKERNIEFSTSTQKIVLLEKPHGNQPEY